MQLKHNHPFPWNMVETIGFSTLITYFQDAKLYGNVFAIVGQAGCGKTFAARWYCESATAVIHLECAEYWNRRIFLEKMAKAAGLAHPGSSMGEMMDNITSYLSSMHQPLLIIDEADKLPDQVFCFFISLYNHLKGKCGIILMATTHLAARIERGRKLNKRGYAEIFSRIGRRFIPIGAVNKKEMISICNANAITDETETAAIFNECEGDLRRLEREIHKRKRKALKPEKTTCDETR